MSTKPGYSVRQRGNTITFKSRGNFDLRLAPELQAMGLKPHTLDEGESCKCGKAVPWHLFELDDGKGLFAHNCSCGRKWKKNKDGEVREVA